MANYPMVHRLLILNNADRDMLDKVIVSYELPPSNRMREALTEVFKLGFKQGYDKDRVAPQRKAL